MKVAGGLEPNISGDFIASFILNLACMLSRTGHLEAPHQFLPLHARHIDAM